MIALFRTAARRVPMAALVVSLVGLSTPTSAQSDEERAGARAAATAGAQAMNEQRWADAVDLFTRAESLVHAPPHLLYMARAYTALGQLVKARETYLKLTREALPANAPNAFVAAQADGAKDLAALEPRVPTLKVSVKSPPPSLVVTMDDAAVPAALVGVPRPVDPGTHMLRATADGLASDPVTVDLKEGGREDVTLVLKAVAASAVPASGGHAKPEPQGGAAPAGDTGPSSSPSNGLRTASYVAMGGGVVALAAGTYFAIRSHGKRVDGDNLCPNGVCQMSDKAELDSLDSAATSSGQLAAVSFVVGGLAATTGVTLFILSNRKGASESAQSKRGAVTPWLGLGSAGVSGSF